jgi:hypothetical protein
MPLKHHSQRHLVEAQRPQRKPAILHHAHRWTEPRFQDSLRFRASAFFPKPESPSGISRPKHYE